MTTTNTPATHRNVTVGAGHKVHATFAGATLCGAEGRNPLARTKSLLATAPGPVTCNSCRPDAAPSVPTQPADHYAEQIARNIESRRAALSERMARLTAEGQHDEAAQVAVRLGRLNR